MRRGLPPKPPVELRPAAARARANRLAELAKEHFREIFERRRPVVQVLRCPFCNGEMVGLYEDGYECLSCEAMVLPPLYAKRV